jgi:hypothetical protein
VRRSAPPDRLPAKPQNLVRQEPHDTRSSCRLSAKMRQRQDPDDDLEGRCAAYVSTFSREEGSARDFVDCWHRTTFRRLTASGSDRDLAGVHEDSRVRPFWLVSRSLWLPDSRRPPRFRKPRGRCCGLAGRSRKELSPDSRHLFGCLYIGLTSIRVVDSSNHAHLRRA